MLARGYSLKEAMAEVLIQRIRGNNNRIACSSTKRNDNLLCWLRKES